MKFNTLPEFDRDIKLLAKKYRHAKEDNESVAFLTIYDKSDMESIDEAILDTLISRL